MTRSEKIDKIKKEKLERKTLTEFLNENVPEDFKEKATTHTELYIRAAMLVFLQRELMYDMETFDNSNGEFTKASEEFMLDHATEDTFIYINSIIGHYDRKKREKEALEQEYQSPTKDLIEFAKEQGLKVFRGSLSELMSSLSKEDMITSLFRRSAQTKKKDVN